MKISEVMRTGPAESGGSEEEGGEEDRLCSLAHVGDREGEGGGEGWRERGRRKMWVWLGFIHDVDAWQKRTPHLCWVVPPITRRVDPSRV